MPGAYRYIGGLVLGEQEGVLVAGHARGAADHDPVFRAMVMHLQRQGRPRLDRQALDLETAALVHAFEGAPGTVYAAMELALAALVFVQVLGDLLHVLGMRLVRHQHRIGRLHHHQVVHPHRSDHTALREQQIAVRVPRVHVAMHRVALLVLLRHRPQGLPGADVGPAGIQRHHHAGVAVARQRLHHRVVDGIGRTGGKGVAIHTVEIEIGLALVVGGLHRLQDRRGVAPDQLQPTAGGQHEDAAVPQVATMLQILLRGFRVGLLDEFLQPRGPVRHGLAAADIAISGVGAIGHDAEGHHLPLRRLGQTLAQRLVEGLLVGNDMIGRHDQQHRVFAAGARMQCRQGQRGRGVAPHRLEQDVACGTAAGEQLVGDQEAVYLVAHHDRRLHPAVLQPVTTGRGGLQQGQLVDQCMELLGKGLARERPQARARPARENHRL